MSPGSPTCWLYECGQVRRLSRRTLCIWLRGQTRWCFLHKGGIRKMDDGRSKSIWDALGVSGRMQGYHLGRYRQSSGCRQGEGGDGDGKVSWPEGRRRVEK